LAGVKVLRIEACRIYFVGVSGSETYRDLDRVWRITAESEPALSAAEEAYAPTDATKADVGRALDGWSRALRSASQPWVRYWCARRLSMVAGRVGKYDLAMGGFVELVEGRAADAWDIRPKLGGPSGAAVEGGIAVLEQALATRKWDDTQQVLALRLLLEASQAGGKATQTAQLLDRLTAKGFAIPGSQTDPGAIIQQVLTEATGSLGRKDYGRALATIEENRARFSSPREQAEALFIRARAKEGLAGGLAGDAGKLLSAALDYMRVVAHFKNVEGAQGRVSECQLGAARILAAIGKLEESKSLLVPLASCSDPSIRAAATDLLRGMP
jgi:hypothetical protein